MSLSVKLAGYNIDSDLIADVVSLLQELQRHADSVSSDKGGMVDSKAFFESLAEKLRTNLQPESFTPETISAAYARISRDPKHVTELRKAARFGVARARKSNENIIFGLGHASVAEHAAFNFDVSGLSRLASEDLQSHRLLSFTEKSQRYITIGEDFVLPPEVIGTPQEKMFNDFVPTLFAGYNEVCSALTKKYLPEDTSSLDKNLVRDLENKAKEDARYLLPLCCTTQMGMTLNARNIEHVMLSCSDHPLQEIRDLGKAIGDAVAGVTPSIVKYTTRGSYPRTNREEVSHRIDETGIRPDPVVTTDPHARLVEHSPDAESKVLRAFAFTSGHIGWLTNIDSMDEKRREALWQEIFRGMGEHDGAMREFELARITFEVEVSAACFAQLKRHRMMTILSQDYSLEDGAVMPPAIESAGLEDMFTKAVTRSVVAARKLSDTHSLLAPYLLTNAHRKRVILEANARELYHFVRLRSDAHAQWEIRKLSDQIISQTSTVWPNLMRLACGKDKFRSTYESRYK